MKQFTKFAAAAVATLVAMSSCMKDGNEAQVQNNEGTTSVKIQVVYPQDTPDSRVEGTPVSNNTALVFNKPGHIFFCTPAGLISKHVGVGNSAGSVQVSLSDLTTGEAVIEDVLSEAKTCYIVSNLPTDITGNIAGSDINVVLNRVLTVANINHTTGDVSKVPLFGTGTVTAGNGSTSGSKDYNASVQVNINALASRLQIGKISGKTFTPATGDPTVITAFEVEGIYIHNVHKSMTVGSVGSDLFNGGQTMTNYAATYYNTNGMACLTDMPGTPVASGSPLEVVPDGAGKYWVYNLFPTNVAHIVVKLSSVKYKTGSAAEVPLTEQYLTIGKLKYSTAVNGHAVNDDVTAFAPNQIYTLGDIAFDYTHLSNIPEDKPIDVLVSVNMMKWQDNPIYWAN